MHEVRSLLSYYSKGRVMKLLANENFPIASVKLLRENKFDITAIAEISAGDSDKEVLNRAIVENRIILTFDRDYRELIYRLKLPTPPGIIYLRFVPKTPLEPAEYILNLMDSEKITFEGKFTVGEICQLCQRPLPRKAEQGKQIDKIAPLN